MSDTDAASPATSTAPSRLNGRPRPHRDFGDAHAIVHTHHRVEYLDPHDSIALLCGLVTVVLWGGMIVAGILDADAWVALLLYGAMLTGFVAAVATWVTGWRRRRRRDGRDDQT